jgi:hypothetical protein
MIERFEVDEAFDDYLSFTDEATSYLSGKVNKKNVRFWGTEKPHVTTRVIRDSPEVNGFVLCQRQTCMDLSSLRKVMSLVRRT